MTNSALEPQLPTHRQLSLKMRLAWRAKDGRGCGHQMIERGLARIDSGDRRNTVPVMTAIQVIKQIKALSVRERAKVQRFIYANRTPNATTRKTLADADKGRELVRSKNLGALLADLKS